MPWISDFEFIFCMVCRKFKTSVSFARFFDLTMQLNENLFSQSLTSIGTISAIGLIPLWLYLYSSSYTPIDGNKAIPVPYGPICRTLSILIQLPPKQTP